MAVGSVIKYTKLKESKGGVCKCDPWFWEKCWTDRLAAGYNAWPWFWWHSMVHCENALSCHHYIDWFLTSKIQMLSQSLTRQWLMPWFQLSYCAPSFTVVTFWVCFCLVVYFYVYCVLCLTLLVLYLPCRLLVAILCLIYNLPSCTSLVRQSVSSLFPC